MNIEPSNEQAFVLDNLSGARIRVVQSAPGSGKTWLVAEEIRRLLKIWPSRHNGIAALSFTNVANKEIHTSLGFLPGHPHFTGTLDTFIFRYITQPFRGFHPDSLPPLQLIPAERAKAMGDKQKWTQSALNLQVGPKSGERANLFLIDAFGIEGGQIRFAAKWKPSGREAIALSQNEMVLASKRKIWRRGFISHSDNAVIAYEILQHRGKEVRKLLLKRFPVLIVDEFQDTGWFHGQILLNLLGDPSTQGLVVGDPDQAIYEFNGATPALFGEALALPGAEGMHLATSRRCPAEICVIAQHLRSSGGPLLPTDGRKGEAFLIEVPNGIEGTKQVLSALLRSYPEEEHVVLCRNGDSVDGCIGGGGAPGKRPGSPVLKNLHESVLHLRLGRAKTAIELSESALLRAAFGSDAVRLSGEVSENWRQGILRKFAMRLLLAGHQSPEGESMLNWGIRMKERVRQAANAPEIARLPNHQPETLKSFHRKETSNELAFQPIPQKTSGTLGKKYFRTIHGAKGETHSTTILFLPDPARDNRLVSRSWWSGNAGEQEERRVAYVAITRSEKRLILCVEPKNLRELKTSRPEFISHFKEVTLDQLETVLLATVGKEGGSV